MDYDLARENFTSMGEMMIRFIYEFNQKWKEFLNFYTGINKNRKTYDNKFKQKHYIGEEIDEPLGNSTDEEIQQLQRQQSPYDVEHKEPAIQHSSSDYLKEDRKEELKEGIQ